MAIFLEGEKEETVMNEKQVKSVQDFCSKICYTIMYFLQRRITLEGNANYSDL